MRNNSGEGSRVIISLAGPPKRNMPEAKLMGASKPGAGNNISIDSSSASDNQCELMRSEVNDGQTDEKEASTPKCETSESQMRYILAPTSSASNGASRFFA